MMKPKMLLHICCAPCSTHVIEVLKEGYDLTGYFYNPNIHPQSEYLRREGEMKRYAQKIGFELVCAEYDPARWFDITRGMEDIPEGGERCSLCYEMRLSKSAQYAKEHGFQSFTTTLSISPHKDAGRINEIGSKIANQYQLQFYAADFKKRGGFERSIRMSKEIGLYRQSYCGCVFSANKTDRRLQRKRGN